MANISITTECNRRCSYCFAGQAGLSDVCPTYMSKDTFLKALDFLKRSDIHQVRLLGGEPTLHPDFLWFVEQTLQRGFRLLVFSNGLMPRTILSSLEKYTTKQMTILLNVNSPENHPLEENRRQIDTLQRLNRSIILGFNIHKAVFDLDFLFDISDKFDVSRSVRLGLAHPCLNGQNEHLIPEDYFWVGQKVYDFFRKALKKNLSVEFDCGFVPCMFPREFFTLQNHSIQSIGRRCGVIPDILPDGSVIHCYPLASLGRLSLKDRNGNAEDLKREFERQTRPFRSLGIFRDCASCTMNIGSLCNGGCLSLAMKRLRSGSFSFQIPEFRKKELRTATGNSHFRSQVENLTGKDPRTTDHTQRLPWIIPYIDQPIDFWERIHDTFGRSIQAVYLPLPNTSVGSARPSQPDIYLQDFLRRSPFALSVLVNPIILPQPIKKIAGLVLNNIKRFQEQCDLKEVTISNLRLAKYIKEKLPAIDVVASTLMDVSKQNQVAMLEDACDTIVPASRILRDIDALKKLRQMFKGRIRLIVNESCLPGCPFRIQHFFEMASDKISFPQSLCTDLLRHTPWLRLTGSWILPQHLHLYEGLYDELKLAGRVTLQDPKDYLRVLDAYIHAQPLMPHEIGGGPASILEPIVIEEEFFKKTLFCKHECHRCNICKNYYHAAFGENIKQAKEV
jgi:MoaA/NifB/PqqE/SkfB family radical SAM enzyme/collagenase-like PrtC family protease